MPAWNSLRLDTELRSGTRLARLPAARRDRASVVEHYLSSSLMDRTVPEATHAAPAHPSLNRGHRCASGGFVVSVDRVDRGGR